MASSYAQLSWDLKQTDIYPRPEDTTAKVEFRFTNRGDLPVTVQDVQTDCGCTTAKLDKKTYLSGEDGAISAVFTFGEQQGLQQKHVTVRTDHPQDPFIQLTIRAFIPEFLRVEPKFVRWDLGGGSPEPKTLVVKVGPEVPLKVVGVSSTDSRILPSLRIIEPGKEYAITVTAADLREPAKAILRVETNYPAAKPRFLTIPALILPPASTLATAK